MDCFKYNCPLRVNETSNSNKCECFNCQNRDSGFWSITWNRTLTKKDEMDEIKRKSDPNYGVGVEC